MQENLETLEGKRSSGSFLLSQNEVAEILGITSNAVSIAASKLGLQSKRIGRRATFSSKATRKIFEERGFHYPKEVISFQMLKGGSTKTSSAFNLAVRLNQYGARVLCIDLDMQGNLTDAFGFEVTTGPVFYHVAAGEADIQEVVVGVSENLDLIPSDFENSTLDFLITSKRLDLRRFVTNSIAKIRDNYDFIIIDCNPALSSLNISIALSSDRVLIPVNPDKFAAKGLKKTIDELERVSNEYGKPISYNLLYTLYDGREASSHKYLLEYGSKYKERLIPTVIKRNADVKNALDQKKSIFDFPKASAREDFDLLARGILGFSPKGGNA
jgi:chromosome partitioning protein